MAPTNKDLTSAPRSSSCGGPTASSTCARRSAGPRQVRLHPHRLPAGLEHADDQRAGRRPTAWWSRCSASTSPSRASRALDGTIERVRATSNPKLEIQGILRTMYDPRNNLASEVSAQLSSHFGDRVYNTVIPRNVRLAEAPSFGRPFARSRQVFARGARISRARRRGQSPLGHAAAAAGLRTGSPWQADLRFRRHSSGISQERRSTKKSLRRQPRCAA